MFAGRNTFEYVAFLKLLHNHLNIFIWVFTGVSSSVKLV